MTKVGIVGVTGYSGLELLKILLKHPETDISFVSGTSRLEGESIASVFPVLRGQVDLSIVKTDIDMLVNSDADCIFMATPHETSLELIPSILQKTEKKVIDLSGAFRLRDHSLYSKHYGFENSHLSLLEEAVYGLPEINRRAIRKARLVANPGCYPTSAILPLYPLLSKQYVDLNHRIVIDSKSGTSGAGRKPSETTHFVQVNESFKAYNLHAHRHEPEILQELIAASDNAVKISFTPHLLPINRGILSTIYADLKPSVDQEMIDACLKDTYQHEPFVRILPLNTLPEINHVASTPYCDIGFSVRENHLILVSCIDNLLKGASSQAVQNYNLMFGYRESIGL